MQREARMMIVALLLCYSVFVVAQPCHTFDNGIEGWGVSLATIAPAPGYIVVGDLSGSVTSTLNAPQNWTGNYWNFFPTGCGQFCFDIRMIDDSLPGSPPLARHWNFHSSTGVIITFQTNTIVEGEPWRRFCIPIAPLDANGQMPTTPDGFWSFSPTASLNAANWNAAWSSIIAVRYFVDTSSTQFERFWLDNICLRNLASNAPVAPTISGPTSACVAGSYCLKGNSAFQYTWTAVSTNNEELPWSNSLTKNCIDVSFPPGQGGWINVTVRGSYPFCGSSSSSIFVAPCDVLAEECCKDKKLTITQETVKFSGNKLVFTPTLSYPGLTLKIKTALVSGLYVANVCKIGSTVFQHPVTVTAGSNPNFVGSTHPSNSPYPQSVQWFTNIFGSTSGAFPLIIADLPPLPRSPCYQQIRFCVEYTFFFGCCESCTVVECYSYDRKPSIVVADWPTTVSVKPGELLSKMALKTTFGEQGVIDSTNFTVKIVSAPKAGRLLGAGAANTNLEGAAEVSGLYVTRPGIYAVEVQAVFADTLISPEGEKVKLFADAFEFSVDARGEVYDPVIPPVIKDDVVEDSEKIGVKA